MSQKLTGDDAQKGFAVGRGLLAAAETLNFSMGETHSDHYGSSSQSHSGMSGLGGGEGKDHDSQLSRRAGSHISNTMKLFASLGLSPTDLDALAQVPEENISVETLPHLIMQLKNRKMEAGRRMTGDMSTLSSESSYRSGRDDWGGSQGGRLDRSGGQAQSRSQGDFGYTSTQESSGRGYDMLDYSSGSGRDRQYSDLSHDSYRSLGMSTSSASDDMFMQRRMGTPSQGKVQDFLGVMPLMFPHVCSLCDYDVHSVMEWTQHTNGIRHSENRRLLLQMYPDWDPQLPSSRKSTSLSLDTKSRSDGLLGAAPIGASLQRTGLSSNWGSDSSMGMTSKMTSYSTVPPKIRSRVVVAKYERKPMSPNSLFALAKPFGTICEHLILKNKAFLEMQTHEEALAMANYYQRKPAILLGKEIHIYLSKELMAIEKSGRPDRETMPMKRGVSQVVFFSNLPRGGEKKMELLTIARRFGTVEKHLFLNDEAFVQLSNPEDAEMLVKYYNVNPLTINKRSIRLNICTKYKTLTVPPGKGDQPREAPPRKSSTSSSATSRTGDKPSSKTQRSSSTSKSKGSSVEKEEEPKPEEAEAVGDGSGDEDADVMEARDGDEEGFEEADAEDVEISCDPEQATEQQEDIDDTNVEEEEEEEENPEAHQARDAETAENQEDSDEKQEETEVEEPAASEAEQKEDTSDHPKDLEEQNEEQPEDEGAEEDNAEQEDQNETDFPENIDEFVTLDELAEEEDADKQDSKSKAKNTSGSSKDNGGLRVVNVVGFKRGYGYLDEVLALAKPFGKVVRHLVLDVRPEAFLELSNEQEARAMSSFYSGNVMPSVCGKPVKVYHSQSYPTIQSGRVIYVRNIPPFKGSDALILKIAEPFGKVKRYFLNRIRNECFIEMESWEDAEKMAETYKENRPKFEGKRLVVYVSRKYKQLKHGHRPPSPEPEDKRPLKRERSGESETQSNSSGKSKNKKEEEPSVKKLKVEETVTDKAEKEESQEEKESQNVSAETVPEVKSDPEEEQIKDTSEHQNMETEPQDEETDATPPESEKSEKKTEEKPITTTPPEIKLDTSHATLEPYDPNVPVGVEFVKMGYYCRVCFLFYSNEDTAKKIHCSSQAHYDKLKKYLEKEKAKAQSNGAKK
ncbi:matrin-3-like isoform X1 [Sinocyclocheilus rhinocerous]|uniref:matrin-3-like isoform X1 n=1 Tax=Sinocyclocheilus rhinocerous TaxID=307959 RepID=UPI0007B8DF4A|nr:PREDICTED: matrin-3-like isoform X1 [Sinocyclocheilus rhinocerous]XP_016409136.1 PREDICTED: matrin-3-like isoform X1 [Sinocyclocheilus rhinocerous]